MMEKMTHVLADRFQIEVLQAAVAGVVEKYHDDYGLFFHHGIKKLAEIISKTKIIP